MSFLLEKLTKFSLMGATVTTCSLGTQVILLRFFDTPLIPTYVVVYSLSILISYFLSSRYIFGSDLSLKKMCVYYAIYLSSMGLGTLLLTLYRAILPFENWVLPILVIPITMTWNFLFSSHFLKPNTLVKELPNNAAS